MGKSCSKCGKDIPSDLGEPKKEIINRFGKDEEVSIYQNGAFYWCSDNYYCKECFWKPIKEEELLTESSTASEYVEWINRKEQCILVQPYRNPSIEDKKYRFQEDSSEGSDTDASSETDASSDDNGTDSGSEIEDAEHLTHHIVQDIDPIAVEHVPQLEEDSTMDHDFDIPKKKFNVMHKVIKKKQINLQGKELELAKDDSNDDEEQEGSQDSDSDDQIDGPDDNSNDYKSVDELVEDVLHLQPDFRHIAMDRELLRITQSSLMLHFAKDNDIDDTQLAIILDAVASTASSLCDVDYFLFTQSLALSMHKCKHLDRSGKAMSILELFLRWLVCNGSEDCPRSPWVLHCLSTLLFEMGVHDGELVDMMVLPVATSLWSPNEVLTSYDDIKKDHPMSHNVQMHLFHLIQRFQAPFIVVKNLLSAHSDKYLSTITSKMNNELQQQAKQGREKSLKEIMQQLAISNCRLLSSDMLDKIGAIVENVASAAGTGPGSFSILDRLSQYNAATSKYLSTMKEGKQAMSRLKIPSNPDITNDVSLALKALVCACQKHTYHTPSKVEIMSVCLLILIRGHCFLDHLAGTDIDKSCIIAMFAAVLGVQHRKVDIITGSAESARENAKKWMGFFKLFDLSVAQNTDTKALMKLSATKADEKRCGVYECTIVYGTVSSFSADILRQEFENRQIRSKRRFNIAIVDRAEKFLLDEGTQSVSLFQRNAVLQHVEPVLAMVWSSVKHLVPFYTTDNDVLYAGIPKFFHIAICESTGSSKLKPQQFLQIAVNEGLMFQRTAYVILNTTDAEEKEKAMEHFDTDKMLEFFAKLGDYLPHNIVLYTLNESNVLEVSSGQYNEEEVNVALLVLDKGMVSPLHIQAKLVPAIEKMVLSHIKLAKHHEPYVSKANELVVPSFLKEFVTGRLPVYISSALTALTMTENQEYSIENGQIVPTEFQNSKEESKRWGSGLQQILEMKHQLQLSPIPLMTNFLSHVDFFQKYQTTGEGCLYGIFDTTASKYEAEVLNNEYDVHVCTLPSHSHTVQCEREPIYVEGDRNAWLQQINHIVSDEVRPKCFAPLPGSTALVLCENLQAANDVYGYLKQNGNKEITLQLQGQNVEEKSDNTNVVVSTNLTEPKRKKNEVLCLVTFLPRHKRVVQKAFDYVTQSGSGSVQFVLQVSALPEECQGLDITTMRGLMSEDESFKLATTLKDFKAVQLKGKLFNAHCGFLHKINHVHSLRKYRSVVYDIVNENWCLLLNRNKKKTFQQCLQDTERQWIAKVSITPQSCPSKNLYYCIKLGNQFVNTSMFNKAIQFYDFVIDSEQNFSMIAYYNRAYCVIRCKEKDYIAKSCSDLEEAKKRIQRYREEANVMLQCVTVGEQNTESDFSKQMRARMHVLQALDDRIDKDIKVLKESKKNDDEVEAIPSNIFQLIHLADSVTKEELSCLKELGLEFIFTLKDHPHYHFCWQGLLVCLLGVAQIIVGVALTAFTAGAASEIGTALIAEGVSDCIDGVTAMLTEQAGEWSWEQWAVGKACSIAVSLATGGIGKFLEEGAEIGAKAVAKDVKLMPKIFEDSLGNAAKTNLKNSGKLVGKEFVEQGALRVLSHFENEALEMIVQKIAKSVTEKIGIAQSLKSSFEGTNELGQIVNCKFVSRIPEIFVKEDKMPSTLHQQAMEFFTDVTHQVVSSLLSDSSPYFDQVMSSLSMLIHDISGHLEGKASVLHLFELPLVGVSLAKTEAELVKVFSQFQPKITEYSSKGEGQTEAVKNLRECLFEIAASALSESELKMLTKQQEHQTCSEGHDLTGTFMANLKKDIQERLQKSYTSEQNSFRKIIDCLFIVRLSNGEKEQQIKDEAKAFFEAAANKITENTSKYLQMVTATSEIIPSARQSIGVHQQELEEHLMEEMCKYCCEQLQKVAVAHTKVSALHSHLEKLDLHDKIGQHCRDFFQSSYEHADAKKYTLDCVKKLKKELAEHTANAFSEAIASILLQNLSWLANHILNRTVNKAASHSIRKRLGVERTLEHVRAGQKANYIRSMPPSETEASVGEISAMMTHKRDVLDPKKPGSLSELRVLAELHGCKVTVLKDDGTRECSLKSRSNQGKETAPEITLIHSSPDELNSEGHYDVVINGQLVEIHSEHNNCMYEAFAHGLSAHGTKVAKAKEGESEETEHDATALREAVAKEISQNSGKWVEHFTRKEQLEQLQSGDLFLLKGGAKGTKKQKAQKGGAKAKKPAAKIIPKTYQHKLKACQQKSTFKYEQTNGVKCTNSTAEYTRKLQIEKKRSKRGQFVGNMVKAAGKKKNAWQLKKMVTKMEGLNRKKNIRRRSTTRPSLGQLQHKKTVRKRALKSSPVSGHVWGSRHGASAGSEYGNSFVMSGDLNDKEAKFWSSRNSKLNKCIGDEDFEGTATVLTEPLVPRSMKRMRRYVRALNKQLKKEGKPPLPDIAIAGLLTRLKKVMEKEPSLRRVKSIEYKVKGKWGKGTEKLGRDLMLYVHPNFFKPGYKKGVWQWNGDITNAKRKVKTYIVNAEHVKKRKFK